MSLNKKLSEAIGINKNEKNVKLTEAPTIRKNDTGHFNVFAKFAVVQADLIYITEDKRGYKYILNVVDVASRALDAIPLRGRTAEDVIEGFEKIFKRKYINSSRISTLVTDPGSEFKNDIFHKYLTKKGIKIRHTMTARKNQTSIVEYYNGLIAKHLGQKKTSSELKENEYYDNWSEDLEKMVKVFNSKEFEKAPKLQDFFGEPKIKQNEEILPEGTRVHVRLQQPIDHMVDDKKERLSGKFRYGDLRYEKQTTKINRIIAVPNQPIRYMVEKYNNVSFIRKELLLAGEEDEQPEEQKPEEQPEEQPEVPKPKGRKEKIMTRSRTKTTTPQQEKKFKHWVRENA